MDKIRALLFDDEQSQLSEIRFALEHEWKKFRWSNGIPLPTLELDCVVDRTVLREKLGHGNLHQSYDFFLCDIYVGAAPSDATGGNGPVPEPEGFRFLKMAKEHGLPLCFGLTIGRYGSHESYQKASSDFKRYLDGSYLKSDLRGVHTDKAPQVTLSDMAHHLRSKGLIRAIDSQLVRGDSIQESRTQAIFDDVGESTINDLAAACALPGATGVSLLALSPGLSGAKVLKLVYSGTTEDFGTRPVLLKISRDRASLLRELSNHQEHLVAPSRRLLHTVARPHRMDAGPHESNGWFAISFECAAPAVPLVDWLTSTRVPEDAQVVGLLDRLYFHDHLADLYQTTAQKSAPVLSAVATGLLTPYRRLAIKESIKEFQPLLSKYAKGKWARLDALRTYMEEERLAGVPSPDLTKRLTTACLMHGDMHGRNVLVCGRGSNEEAVLIDIASMRFAVWATDLVRLLCDVFLSCWDRGMPAMEWSNVRHWRPMLAVFAPRTSQARTAAVAPENQAAKVAIDWLLAKKFEVCGLSDDAYNAGEFCLTLAVEFARASYRDRDLPAPKRAFALIAASTLLTEAAEEFGRR